MSLHVICAGCLKRFKVALRFAGMKGPCPNCGEVISIPKESVRIGEDDAAGPQQGKGKKGRIISRPIQRFDLEFGFGQVKYYTLGVLGVLLLTFLLGCIPMYAVMRSFFGLLGLCLIAFPLVLFAYHFLRDREQMFAADDEDLYCRAGITAAGYVLLWIAMECVLTAMRADLIFSCLYFSVFAVLATVLAVLVLELKPQDAFLHFCTFAFPVILLRFLIGLDWIFKSNEFHKSTAPFLPGMQ